MVAEADALLAELEDGWCSIFRGGRGLLRRAIWRGVGEAEVRSYVERWGLVPAEVSAYVIRVLNEPTSWTYIIAYPAGRDLCRAYVAGRPERLRQLLSEQVRIVDLVRAAGQ